MILIIKVIGNNISDDNDDTAVFYHHSHHNSPQQQKLINNAQDTINDISDKRNVDATPKKLQPLSNKITFGFKTVLYADGFVLAQDLTTFPSCGFTNCSDVTSKNNWDSKSVTERQEIHQRIREQLLSRDKEDVQQGCGFDIFRQLNAHPSNRQFLEDIRRGNCPEELRTLATDILSAAST